MRTAIVAHHLWRLGGETVFNSLLARGLCSLGFRVVLAAVSRPSPRVEGLLPPPSCLSGMYTLLPFALEAAAQYQRLLLYKPLARALAVVRPSLVWVDSPTYKPLLGQQRAYALVEYIHFPLELLADESSWERLPDNIAGELRPYFDRYARPHWRAYLAPFKLLYRRVARENPFEAADAVYANSAYIALIARHLWGREPRVLHPPVDPEPYNTYANRGFEERSRSVVALGRISPEKRLEELIEAASMLNPPPRVVVAGSLAPANKAYLGRLRRLAGERRVELSVVANPPRKAMAEAAGSSRVYVHAARGEHFGITVVEAMAAGLPVVVHRSGGPYYDIVDRGRYGIAYESLEELSSAMELLLDDRREWAHYHSLSLVRAEEYTYRRFLERLEAALGRLLG